VGINSIQFFKKISHLKSFRSINDYLKKLPKNAFKYIVLSHSAIILTIKVTHVQYHKIFNVILFIYLVILFKQAVASAPVTATLSSLSHFSGRPLLEI
jgi:hypothetical protein